MSFTAALLILAQGASPQVAEAASTNASARTRPVAVQVKASARVLRPTRIDFTQLQAAVEQTPNAKTIGFQRERDAAGTVWIEFN